MMKITRFDQRAQLGGVTGEKLNLILAICAILISAASFYATYLQANSAERQVKAMTMPLLHFSHGNYDEVSNTKEINFTITNAGVGPAIIKQVRYYYMGQSYSSLADYLSACCADGVAAFKASHQTRRKQTKQSLDMAASQSVNWVSQPLDDVILPGQSEYEFQRLIRDDITGELWDQLNKERWKLALSICFCSMLDECYISEGSGTTRRSSSCRSVL